MLLFGGIWSAPAAAQDFELGYQFQRVTGDGGFNAPLGFTAALAYPIRPNIDVVGQFDWSRHSESEEVFGTDFDSSVNLTTFGGGARWSHRENPDLTPFVQALFGVTHASFSGSIDGDEVDEDSDTQPMFQLGGGVALPIRENITGLAQIDYRRIFTEGEGTNALRIVAGIRLALMR
jgi:hypothetical protein